MKLSTFKRIITEDVKEEYRELVGQLAFSINPFAEEVIKALDNNLSVQDNFNQKFRDVTTEVTSGGTPKSVLQFKTDLMSLCTGIDVVKADCITNPTIYVNSCPFLSFTESSGILTVNNIKGLPADTKFRLRLHLFS